MGIANQKSIAWGIAEVLSSEGASLALTYQGENFKKRVEPLAEGLGSKLIFDVDVTDESSVDRCFDHLSKEWGSLDFVVHALAFSDKSELSGRFINTSRQNFLNSLDISCFSLIDVSKKCSVLMKTGGAILTLSYLGSQRVTPNYNVMGVAKAALESSVRYLASDLGEDHIIPYCYEPTSHIVERLKALHPDVGIIVFPRLIGEEINNFSKYVDADCISLSDDMKTDWILKRMGHQCLQGGIPPEALLAENKEEILRATVPMIRQMKDSAYVVNLAHGINKETPVESVRFFVEIVKRNRENITRETR